MHIPVLQKEVLEYLDVESNEDYIDATVGFAGHTKAILEKNAPDGRVLGIELDNDLYKRLEEKNYERLVLVNDSYANLEKIVEEKRFNKAKGIILDFGFSSWHIDESGRGFSFQKDEPLDMRFNQQGELTAYEIVNGWPKEEIEKLIYSFGEERFARLIAQSIIDTRKKQKIETTLQLAEAVKNGVPVKFHFGRIHPATKTFQALRIVVNEELESINKVMPQVLKVLKKKGRIVVISFHSLEDRIIKNFFRDRERKGDIKILTKKPVIACLEELDNNPRARSAKLRAAIIT
ncbi:MAG: 16S rRNA (cytosine(1402)-N(4))-methyltransferase RsmH [Parcubacteria group bacterium]|nr:16S rRNA (cytosine(1402)-N(4))-methyltransferase RsmH [Parcubacteria group bacterium]